MKLAGLILSGGKNSRMKGEKKFFLEYDGKGFGSRIYEILKGKKQVEEVYLSVDREDAYKKLGIPLIVDEFDSIGPMGGILTGLRNIQAEAILVVACDMPFLTEKAVEMVIEAYEREQKLVIAMADGRCHPLLAIYPKGMLHYFLNQVQRQCYKLQAAIAEAAKQEGVSVVELDQEREAVVNINTVEEYNKIK